MWERMAAVLRSPWTLGLLVAVATWTVGFQTPLPGLDPSWWAGLYIAANRGMQFGSQFIFTYGPLGFLRGPWLFYGNLAVIAFLYQAGLFVALCVSLVWALRRWLSPAWALVAAFFVVVIAPNLDIPIVLATIWCLAALSPASPRWARALVVFGGACLAAIETLVYLRNGPVILAMCVITLLAERGWRRDLPLLLGMFTATFAVLWFATGQGLGNLPDFVKYSFQVVSGYSEAMGVPRFYDVPRAYLIGELLLAPVLIAGAALTSRAGRPRALAAVAIGLAAFSLFKEAAVRSDLGHMAIFYATAAGLIAALAFSRRRLLGVGVLAAIVLVNVKVNADVGTHVNYNPISHARRASDQVRLLFTPTQRARMSFYIAVKLSEQYRLSPATLQLLKGQTVAVDPSELTVAWVYNLNWDPLPAIQDYVAYTSGLDRLDADALRSPNGPQRILRETPAAAAGSTGTTLDLDNRYPAWDPPEKSLAMLCNYVPLQTTARWQVLAKIPNRCGAPRLIRSIDARYGETVGIPAAPVGRVLYAKIHGAGVSGLERIRTLLYRAKYRFAVVNGDRVYRLVPGTAGDGLLMNAASGADYRGPFALSPAVHTIALTGSSGPLRIDLYSMQVQQG